MVDDKNAEPAITPTYAALLAFCAIAVMYLPALAAGGAVVVALVGRKRPWVIAAAAVILGWSVLHYLMTGRLIA